METRSMTKNNISVEDKEVATVLANLHKDNNILKKLKQDKEEKDERIVLCRLNEEGERMRKNNIMKDIILEKAYDEIKILKLIKEYKENQETIRDMIKYAKDPLTRSVLDEEMVRVGVEMSRLYNSLNLY
jgi:hypothetical protein